MSSRGAWPRKRRLVAGQKFGRWTVLSFAGVTKEASRWACRCDCGTERVVAQRQLILGRSGSCGCLKREIRAAALRALRTTHGMSESPEFNTWTLILGRCCNPNNAAFSRYGGRGILICDRWKGSFQAFLEDVGPRPSPEHSIDRIDNNRGYEPSNVRWATRLQQARNKRSNRILTMGGESLPVSVWAERYGLLGGAIRARIDKLGWGIQRAITTPSQSRRSQC